MTIVWARSESLSCGRGDKFDPKDNSEVDQKEFVEVGRSSLYLPPNFLSMCICVGVRMMEDCRYDSKVSVYVCMCVCVCVCAYVCGER